MLRSQIFVNQNTVVEEEIRILSSLAAKYSLDERAADALVREARALLVDFRQTAIDAACGHFSVEITKTLKGASYEIAFVLGREPAQKSGGIMRLFKR